MYTQLKEVLHRINCGCVSVKHVLSDIIFNVR